MNSSAATNRREALIKLLQDQDGDVRTAASSSLERLESAGSIDEIVQLLKEGTRAEKIRAIHALGEIGGELVLPALTFCASRPEEDLKVAAIDALGKVGHLSALSPLLERLQERNPPVQARAIAAISHYRAPGLVGAIKPFLAAGDGLLDAEAALALGRIGDHTLEGRLIDLLSSPHPSTREAAAIALGLLPLS
jgi:HEAT repeat protein